MSNDDELRGSNPIMTTKDVLLEMRADVKVMARNVDVLVSQNLNSRLDAVESWKDQMTGRMIAISAIPTVLALWSILRELGVLPTLTP